MTTDRRTFTLDGHDVPYEEGHSVIDAALAAGHFIPFLCHKPGYEAHGSCRVCTVRVAGKWQTSCTVPAAEGLEVESTAEDLVAMRRELVQFLFTEGNHFCPSCKASGSCEATSGTSWSQKAPRAVPTPLSWASSSGKSVPGSSAPPPAAGYLRCRWSRRRA